MNSSDAPLPPEPPSPLARGHVSSPAEEAKILQAGHMRPIHVEPRRPKPRSSEQNDPREFSPPESGGTAKELFTGEQFADVKGKIPVKPSQKTPVQARVILPQMPLTPGAGVRRRSQPPTSSGGFGVLLFSLGAVVIAALLFTVGNLAYDRGLSQGMKVANAPKPNSPVPPSLTSELVAALDSLGKGNTPEALGRLQKLNKEESGNPLGALKYLVARAAVQTGDVESARADISESILRGERLSDSVTLLAALDLARGGSTSDIEAVRSKLQEAISLDIANPRPHIELAKISRAQGDVEEATLQLRRASTLLDPTTTHAVIEATEVLMKLEVLPTEALPDTVDSRSNAGVRWGRLYIALRKGESQKAAALLSECANEHPRDVAETILNDPAFEEYRSVPPLADFLNSKPSSVESP